MEEQTNVQPPAQNSDLKSFSLYTGKKAPLIIQVIWGLMWLGAIGLLISAILTLFSNPLAGVIGIAIAIFTIITAKSLFAMKKSALRNSIIFTILYIGFGIWGLVSSKFTGGFTANKTEIVEILFGILVALISFLYRERFVN